jgi:hypothetical protein
LTDSNCSLHIEPKMSIYMWHGDLQTTLSSLAIYHHSCMLVLPHQEW